MKHRFIKTFSALLLVMTLLFSSTIFASADSTDQWVTKASMPGKAMYQTAILDGKIFVIGGMDASGAASADVEEYDPATDKWTRKASMGEPREDFQAVVVNNKIYAIGGCGNTDLTKSGISSIEEYDPASDKWTKKVNMRFARCCLSAQVINNSIYIIGGNTSSLEVYDPINNTIVSKASMASDRSFMQSEVINGKIYVIGGESKDETLPGVEEYNPLTDTWTSKAPMHQARFYFQTEVIGNKIYSLGGEGGNGSKREYYSSVEEYDPVTNTWTEKKSMSTKRCGFGTVAVKNKIYAISGFYESESKDTVELSSMEVYDSATDTWVSGPALSIAREDLKAVLLNNKIYALGGWNYGYKGTTEVYSFQEPDPNLTVTASPNKVKVGQQFTTDIAIHNETNICAEDIKLTYDKDLFVYEGATGQTGTKIYKEDASTPGTIRFITACQGKDTAATGDKGLITLKFKAKAKGVGKVDIVKGRIADNATLEEDVADENCGEDTITVDGYQDVNRSGNFTLLDLGVDAYYDGMNASDTDSTKYDADVIPDGKIDDNDLTQITQEILANKDYAPNNY